MVYRFLSLLSFSMALIALCASCYGPLQERKEYPEIQAGERTVLLLRVTADNANGKLVGGNFFAIGGFETGGELKLCGNVRRASTYGNLLGCKYSIGFLSKELSKEGWFYLLLKPTIYYLAFKGQGRADGTELKEGLPTAQRWYIDLPKGSRIIYGGTVHTNCVKVGTICHGLYLDAFLNNDETLAAKIVSEHMPELGAPKTLLLQPYRGGPKLIKRP